MLERFAWFVLRRRGATLAFVGAIVCIGVALLLGGGRLSSGVFHGTESERAEQLATTVTGHSSETTFVVLFRPARADQTFDDVAAAARKALEPLRHDEHVANVLVPDEEPPFLASRMTNHDARSEVAYVTMNGTFATALRAYEPVRAKIRTPDAEVLCTGRLPFLHDLNKTLESDLVRGELVALPLALLVLFLVFRTLVAAALPVAIGAMAVVTGIGFVLGLSNVMDVSSYSINVCSLIGLGVSIDYSLFLVSRYREERSNGKPTDEAIVAAVSTAGRVVAFSGIAVSAGLAGLLFFKGSYLFPMGVAGVIVVVLAVVFAMTAVPAVLSLLGPRIDWVKFPGTKKIVHREGSPMWSRIAHAVMRRPLLFGLPVLVLLLAIGMPFRRLELATADITVLRSNVEARRGYDALKQDLPDLAKNRLTIAVSFPTSPALDTNRIDALVDFAEDLKKIPHVVAVDSLFSADESLGKDELEVYLFHPPPNMAEAIELGKKRTVGERVVTLYASTDAPESAEISKDVVRAIRRHRQVADGTVYVGGQTANQVDAMSFIRARIGRAAATVVIASLVLMFLLLRSVILPIKAVLMNFLSITGSFGALVWIFQEGHLGIAARPLDPALPILLFCVLFGLSMDYEVLLLSRVREAYVETGDNAESVAQGLQRTAGIITSAAIIMIAVFSAFGFARVVLVQAMGVGMALAIFVDATLVRTILVPATMRLLGRLNWWAPRFARRRPKRLVKSFEPPAPAPSGRLSASHR